ncbi:MAG: alpha/beta hydrolase family protein, partial [Armatimonadota bacterium]
VRWMRRWLLGIDDAITEPEFEVFTDEQLQCTPDGQVMLMEGARSVFDLNVDLDKRLATERRKLWRDTPRAQALQKVRDIVGVRRLADIPACKQEKVGEVERDGYRIEKVILRPDDGIPLPALAFLPPRSNDDAYLYLHEEGKAADAGEGGAIEALVRQGHVVLAVDVRGLGETGDAAGRRRDLGLFGPYWGSAFLAYFLAKSYVGMRTEDILVSARVLREYRKRANPYRIHLIAIGEVGPPALHAAALEPSLFASLTLKRSLASWSSVVATPDFRNQLVNAVHGALTAYDLPDLLATLPEEKVTVEEPVDAAGEPLAQ